MILIVVIAVLDFTYYYPEKYQIEDYDLKIFEVSGKDSSTNCYRFKESNNILKGELLLGIRFKLKFVSLDHESIFNKRKAPYGSLGHVDSIIKLSLIQVNNGRNVSNELLNAESYKNFYSVNDELLINHSVKSFSNNQNCYSAQSYNSLGDFIGKYNSNSIFVSSMDDYLLFKLSDSLSKEIRNKKNILLEMSFSDGRKIAKSF